jgi:hypothetical protein
LKKSTGLNKVIIKAKNTRANLRVVDAKGALNFRVNDILEG